MEKRLKKSSKQKVLCGVCGGFAEYFNIDPTIIRLIWAVLSFMFGCGIVTYIICALELPKDDDNRTAPR